MMNRFWNFLKRIFKHRSQNQKAPAPTYQRTSQHTTSEIKSDRKIQKFSEDLLSRNSKQTGKKENFDIKEFITSLEDNLKQNDKSKEKDNCLKALSIAKSLSNFQTEQKKVDLIEGMISYKEAILTLRAVRWKEGIFCPSCLSKNIKVLKVHSEESKYLCLDCAQKKDQEVDDDDGDGEGDGDAPHIFDDLTGLDIEKDMASVVKWVLAIYLQCFLSIGKISKYLGVDPKYAIHLIHLVNQDSNINKKKTPDFTKKDW